MAGVRLDLESRRHDRPERDLRAALADVPPPLDPMPHFRAPGSSVISEVFDTLAHHGVNVDIIVHDKPAGDAGMRVGFTVAKSDLDTTRRAVDALVKAKGYGELTLAAETDLSKVSVVGVGMRSYAGVAGRTFTALTSQDIDIHMISTSEIKISVVVSSREADRATRALHAEFVKKAKA